MNKAIQQIKEEKKTKCQIIPNNTMGRFDDQVYLHNLALP